MSERILQVVEEVKEASKLAAEAQRAYEEAENITIQLHKVYVEKSEVLRDAERKLKGVIYEETQT